MGSAGGGRLGSAFSAPYFDVRVPGVVFLRGEGDDADEKGPVERISASNFMAFLGSGRRLEGVRRRCVKMRETLVFESWGGGDFL